MSRQTTILASSLLFTAIAVVWLLRGRDDQEVASDGEQAAPQRVSPRAATRDEASVNPWTALTRDTLPVYERLEIARSISPTLGDDDIATLFSALSHTPRAGGADDWYLVLNEIMEQMRRHGVAADRYAEALGAIIMDPDRPEVVRDYAIQHLALWIAPADSERFPHESDPETVAASLGQMKSVIRDESLVSTSIPGTALLALTDITPRIPATAAIWEDLAPYLNGVISGKTGVPSFTRIAAMQAVSRTAQDRYLPVIRTLAEEESGDPSVRLSSIASLGVYGSLEDRPLLETLAASGGRYSYAARSALKRLPLE